MKDLTVNLFVLNTLRNYLIGLNEFWYMDSSSLGVEHKLAFNPENLVVPAWHP